MQLSAVLVLVLAALLAQVCVCMPSVSVVASVRGKKYDVTAETIDEFTTKVEELAGLEAGQQSVLFRGKVLKAGDRLDDLGISKGDVLNVVKGRKTRPAADSEVVAGMSGDVSKAPPSLADLQGMSADALKNPEEMQKAMQAMDQLLDSDFIDDYFSDDEKLEKARLEMLAKLDEYEKMMPGFKAQAQDIASDPERWRQAMVQAKTQISAMKQQRDALRSGKAGGVGGAAAGVPPSLSGSSTSSSSKAVPDKDSVDDVDEEE